MDIIAAICIYTQAVDTEYVYPFRVTVFERLLYDSTRRVGGRQRNRWQGLPTVAERLRELRAEHPFAERERSWVGYEIAPDTGVPGIGEMAIDTERLMEVVRSHWERLGVLELHLVAYPYPVEYGIAPSAIVLSPSLDPGNQQQFEERFVRVVGRFII